MKLLRDFIRLRTAGRSTLRRRAAHRHVWTVTVPAPIQTRIPTVALDMHWHRESGQSRPVARWHEHIEKPSR